MAFAQNLGGLIAGIEEQNLSNDQLDALEKMSIAPEYYGGDYETTGYAGDFNPVQYDTPEDAKYNLVDEDPRTRQLQMDALQRIIDQSSGAADMRSNAARSGALDEANQLANAREGAIRMDMARKGQGGAGMDAVLRAQAAQAAANRAKSGTLDAVHNAALEKLAASGAQIGAAGDIRGQDFRKAATNAEIVNSFNRANTAARNAARSGNVDMRNQAGMRNTNARQSINNAQANTKNSSIDRRDRITGATHNAKMDRFALENDIRRTGQSGSAQAAAAGAGMASDLGQAALAGFTGGMGGAGGGAARMTAGGTGAAGGSITNPLDPEKDWLYT